MLRRRSAAVFVIFSFIAVSALTTTLVVPAQARRIPHIRAEVPLLDTIDVVIRRRSIIAVDPSVGFDVARTPLEVREEVLWSGTRGRVAMVITDKRVLAISTGTPHWQETRFWLRESLPSSVSIGDRVALVTTSHRVIGMGSSGGPLKTHEISTHEELLDVIVGDNLAVVITDKRMLGLSAFAGGFFQEAVGIHEDLDYAKASADFATVTTDRRLVIFDANSGDWRSRRLRFD